jgi:hypothetical protein
VLFSCVVMFKSYQDSTQQVVELLWDESRFAEVKAYLQ